jgi:altronate dehydratase
MGDGKRVLVLDERDSIAVALEPLEPGDRVASVVVTQAIPFGHKVALTALAKGDAVVKYGEVIGIATSPIDPGAHVHTHNLVSARLDTTPGASC